LLPQELAKRYSVVERLLSDDKIRQAALEMVKRGSITGCWRAFDWFCQISRLAVCRQLWAREQSRSRRCQDAAGDGSSAHVVITPRSSGNVLAHSRSAAKKIPEFAVALAIVLSGYIALEAKHWPTSTLDAAVILLKCGC
jgi:hypothetical protein